MTKQEFLKELKDRLAGTDENLRTEICADIDLHFQDGIASGLKEEEICRNLGQPGNIADQIMEEHKNKPYKDAKPEASPPQTNETNGSQRKGPIGGGYYDIDIDKTFTGVNDIDVKLKTNNLTIKCDNQSQQFRVTVKGRSRYNMFTVENIGGELCVIEDTPFIKFELFNIKTKLETVIWVPSYFKGNIKIHVTNGEININGVRGQDLDVKSAVKSVQLDKNRFSGYDIHASAGRVEMRQCEGEKIKLSASAGSVTVEECVGDMDIHASAGSITVNKHNSQKITIKASAGSVTLTECSGEIYTNASAGSVRIKNNDQVLGNVKIESAAGSVKAEALQTGDLDISSAAGSIKAKVERIEGEIRLQSGAGSVKLETKHVNGNIKAHSSVGSVSLLLPNKSVNRAEVESRMGGVTNHMEYNEQSPYFIKASSQMGSVKIEVI
jgi:DUF4097 and DUF4098 domain-containing protein YvlB